MEIVPLHLNDNGPGEIDLSPIDGEHNNKSGTMLWNMFGDALSPNLGKLGLIVPLLSTIKGGKYAPHVQKGLVAVGAGQFAWDSAKRAREWHRERQEKKRPAGPEQFVIFTEAGTKIANFILTELRDQNAGNVMTDANTLSLRMVNDYVTDEDGDTEYVEQRIILSADSELQAMYLRIGEFKYTVKIETGKPGSKSATGSGDEDPNKYVGDPTARYTKYVYVYCRGEEAVDAFRNWLIEKHPRVKMDRGAPSADLYMWNATNKEWEDRYGRVSRTLESVVLDEGQTELIMRDIQKFLNQENDYIEYGATWRRGLLLYGPPGGGKTSFVTAMASAMELDIYYLDLNGITNNDMLNAAVRSVRPRSIIVFEDVDIVVPERTDGTSAGKTAVTLNALLNVIDGMMTPHGAIFVMTTNEVDKLDPALVRPGRVDLKLEIGYLTDYQARKLAARFFKREVELPKIERDIMPAALAGIFKDHLEDRDAAYPEIVALITGERPDESETARALEAAPTVKTESKPSTKSGGRRKGQSLATIVRDHLERDDREDGEW